MVQTTRLQLPLIAAAQAQKHVTHNEAVLRLDGLCQMQALSYTVSAQPGSPADGDLYLLPAGKTGTDWGGAANHAAAHYYDGVWHFYAPRAGWLSFIADTVRLVYYTGTSWADVLTPSGASAADGSAAAPGFAFAADTNTGLYRIGADQIGVATGGTLRKTISTTAETNTLPRLGPDGSNSAPAISFSGDTDNGLYRIGTNNPGMAAGGQLVQSWSSSGITRPLQPAFSARLTSTLANVTGDGTMVTLTGLTEMFDQGANFDPSTGVFTAPVTGRYAFGGSLSLKEMTGSHTLVTVDLVTSNRTYYSIYQTQSHYGGYQRLPFNWLADMDAGDTATVTTSVSGSTKVVDILSTAAAHVDTGFFGSLVA
jgi:hypothetical protein